MTTTAKDIDYDVLKELECPVCFEFMESPIVFCTNGHNICDKCKQKLGNCPTCRGRFMKIRNLALENIALSSMYPCKNREAGCTEVFPMDQKIRSNHQFECAFETQKCPFVMLSGTECPWTGLTTETKLHIQNNHSYECSTWEMPGACFISLEDFSASKRYRTAIFTLSELFFLFFEIKDSHLFCTVIYIGLQKDAPNFKYRFTITNGVEIISMCFLTQSFMNDIDRILQPGECVMLHYGTVAKFLDKRNTLHCEMEIYETNSGPIKVLRGSEASRYSRILLLPFSCTNTKEKHRSNLSV